MEVKDWENLVLNTEVGSHCFVTLMIIMTSVEVTHRSDARNISGITSASPGYMGISFISKK